MSPLLVTVLAGLLGLVIGSFLNVVIHRLPVMMDRDWKRQAAEILGTESTEAQAPYDLMRPGSACPACNASIRPHHNIPLLSWLMLKGRCADCGARISARYPTVELITGLLSALVIWHFGPGLQGGLALFFTCCLIALTVIDLDRQLLPDSITLLLLWVGLIASLFSHPETGQPLFTDPASAIVGAAAGYLILWSVYQGFRLLTGKEGMGYGDFKLLAALGAWLGWQALPMVILLSAVAGTVIGLGLIVFRRHDRQIPIPFGPYLAVAGFVALLWGEPLAQTYRELAGL